MSSACLCCCNTTVVSERVSSMPENEKRSRCRYREANRAPVRSLSFLNSVVPVRMVSSTKFPAIPISFSIIYLKKVLNTQTSDAFIILPSSGERMWYKIILRRRENHTKVLAALEECPEVGRITSLNGCTLPGGVRYLTGDMIRL